MNKVQKIRELIEKRYEYWKEKEFNSHSVESEIRMSECQHLLLMIDSVQKESVEEDLEKEIQLHLKECLDVKFPTTDVELIKKDVAYTARKFFELGMAASNKVQKEE